jgi:hypothetical protein
VSRRVSLTGIAIAAACLVAAPAFAGNGVGITASKKENGPFTSNPANVNMEIGDVKSIWFKVKNRTGQRVNGIGFEFNHKATPGAFTVRVFDGKRNVSQDALGDGHRFGLKSGEANKLQVRLKQKDPGAMCFNATAEKPSVGDDTVPGSVNAAGLC